MSDLNEQPGLFDDIDQAPSDEPLNILESQNEVAVKIQLPKCRYLSIY